jgi:hypothetical protein
VHLAHAGRAIGAGSMPAAVAAIRRRQGQRLDVADERQPVFADVHDVTLIVRGAAERLAKLAQHVAQARIHVRLTRKSSFGKTSTADGLAVASGEFEQKIELQLRQGTSSSRPGDPRRSGFDEPVPKHEATLQVVGAH